MNQYRRFQWIMPDLIDAGYDIINPVQTNCLELELQKLKDEFGKNITFWGGGCDTASILNKATPAEIRTHVLERCELFSKGGGFIFNTIHNILPEVPAENIIAAFDAVKTFNNRYTLRDAWRDRAFSSTKKATQPICSPRLPTAPVDFFRPTGRGTWSCRSGERMGPPGSPHRHATRLQDDSGGRTL